MQSLAKSPTSYKTYYSSLTTNCHLHLIKKKANPYHHAISPLSNHLQCFTFSESSECLCILEPLNHRCKDFHSRVHLHSCCFSLISEHCTSKDVLQFSTCFISSSLLRFGDCQRSFKVWSLSIWVLLSYHLTQT